MEYEDMIAAIDRMLLDGEAEVASLRVPSSELVWWNNARHNLERARQNMMSLLTVEEQHAMLLDGEEVSSFVARSMVAERLGVSAWTPRLTEGAA